jgi:DNA mismatch repair protein MutL
MKGSATEFGHISDQLLRSALPHPNVSFKLLHGGRIVLDMPATSETERLLAAWPEDFREQRLPIESRDAEVKLRGLIGLPELARPTPKFQHLFLNGRPIRDRFMQHALREAYRGLTEPGRYPAAILLLTVPPPDVDVNVHPTKVEVRFRDSGRIHGLVLAVVREKLLSNDLTPAAVPMRTDLDDRARQDMQSKLAAFFRGEFPNVTKNDNGVATAGAGAPSPSPGTPGEGWGGGSSSLPLPTPRAFEFLPPQRSTTNPILPTLDRPPADHAPSPQPSPRVQGEGVAGAGAIQLHNSYLVAESDDGLIIIDQHALHERIMFEELIARVTRGPLESQRLLIPVTLPASSRQIAMLEQIQSLLNQLGIEVQQFGPATVAVQAFPSFLEKLEPAEFVRELLERGEQELLDLHEEELLHEILDMMACKAAVKAGDPLTAAEIQALLARRDLVERSSNCPHGRPTTLRLTLRDLEKQFKRTGF